MEAHQELGPGFLEAVYQDALAHEFSLRQILLQREVELPVFYKNRRLTTTYRADFICYKTVIVELKALGRLSTLEQAQIFNHLKATGLRTGLLLNFGAISLEYKRFACSKNDIKDSPQSVQVRLGEDLLFRWTSRAGCARLASIPFYRGNNLIQGQVAK